MLFFFLTKAALKIVRTKTTGVKLYGAEEIGAPITYLSEQQIQSHVLRKILVLPEGAPADSFFVKFLTFHIPSPLSFISFNQF